MYIPDMVCGLGFISGLLFKQKNCKRFHFQCLFLVAWKQGCGSGSNRIRNYLLVRTRIRNLISDPDLIQGLFPMNIY
jgi:hypothetical protein